MLKQCYFRAVDDAVDLLLQIGKGRVSLADSLGMHPKILGALTDKAIGLIGLGKLEEAAAELEDLARLDGTNPTLTFFLAACLAKQERHEAAIDAYDETVRRGLRLGFDSVVPRAQMCKAQSELTLGRLEAARQSLARVTEGTDQALSKEARVALERLSADSHHNDV